MLIDLHTPSTGPRASRRPSRFWAPRSGSLTKINDALANDIVLLRGPTGVGKSAIVRQLASDLTECTTTGVQIVEGTALDAESVGRIEAAFRDAPEQHILIVDGLEDPTGQQSELLLGLLRRDPDLRLVVATRRVTRLESPLVSLDFDVQALPAEALVMSVDEVGLVLSLNGIEASDDIVRRLHAGTHGWPAIVQLAASRLRLEGVTLRTDDEAAAVASDAVAAFAVGSESGLPFPVTDGIRLLATAPYVTAELARAIGAVADDGAAAALMDDLQEGGLVWPGSTRLTLAEPLRAQWAREAAAARPDLVETARGELLAHLVDHGEPLLAGRLAADAGDWVTLATVLRAAAPEVWARDAESFDDLVAALRRSGTNDPLVLETLLAVDPVTATSPETPAASVAALGRLMDAKTAAATDIEKLVTRVTLLRAAGRFALATEAAALLVDALRRRSDLTPELTADAWFHVGMTHFAMGRLRDAAVTLGLAERASIPPLRVRALGASAVVALVEGDVTGAAAIVSGLRGDRWVRSPWGESIRLAEAWLALEDGRADDCLDAVRALGATRGARELWPYAAVLQAQALLLSGGASDALGALRTWSTRTRTTPPSHFQSTQMLTARAKVLIALRQARKAVALFEEPYGLSGSTASSIALSQLYAGRTHEAYVLSVKWGVHHEPSPRAALESLVVSIVADLRLNGESTLRTAVQRAEALTMLHSLWTPWSVVSPEDRGAVFGLLSESTRDALSRRRSFFASAVSVAHLTKREMVVLLQLTPTSTIADIARSLVVSPNTVKTQLQSLYRKLQVSDRSSAIRAAHAWGLIEGEPEI